MPPNTVTPIGHLAWSHANSKFGPWTTRTQTWGRIVRMLTDTTLVKRSDITANEYYMLPKPEKDKHKDHGGFLLGRLKSHTRKHDDVLDRSGIALDIDKIDKPKESIRLLLRDTLGDGWDGRGLEYVVYPSHSHNDDTGQTCLRVIVPLSSPCAPEQYPAICRRVMQWINPEIFDMSAAQANRFMYMPAIPYDLDWFCDHHRGQWLDPQSVLDTYNDWTDVRQWPTNSQETEVRKRIGGRRQPPEQRQGLPGVVQRVYGIEGVLQTFLEDVWTPPEPGGERYTHTGGETANGGVILNDNWLYSFHGNSDPYANRALDAFEAVQYHKFGDRDEGYDPSSTATRPSYTAALHFFAKDPVIIRQQTLESETQAASDVGDFSATVGTEDDEGGETVDDPFPDMPTDELLSVSEAQHVIDIVADSTSEVLIHAVACLRQRNAATEVKQAIKSLDLDDEALETFKRAVSQRQKTLRAATQSEARASLPQAQFMDKEIAPGGWRTQLVKDPETEEYRRVQHNVSTILRWTTFNHKKLRFDTFKHAAVWVDTDTGVPDPMDDVTSINCHSALEHEWFRHGLAASTVDRAILAAAAFDPFNSAIERIDGLVWDGVPRLDTWLSDYAGAEPSYYHSEVGRRWFVSVVARMTDPGCQNDVMLILEGGQGTRKSTLLRVLCLEPGWFNASMGFNDSDKDLGEKLAGKVINEFQEMDGFSRTDVKRIKRVISTAVDRYRDPYARHATDHPRCGVFVCTTNESGGYLRDDTGARRFWPVKTKGLIDIEGVTAVRDQLWAEALTLYKAGTCFWADDEFQNIADKEQDKRHAHHDDHRTGLLENFLNGLLKGEHEPLSNDQNSRVRTITCMPEIVETVFGIAVSDQRNGRALANDIKAMIERSDEWEYRQSKRAYFGRFGQQRIIEFTGF